MLTEEEVTLGTGAAYTVMIFDEEGAVKMTYVQDINTNDVSMLYILPQSIIITAAEIMISITGLEFSFTQAPVTL